MGRIRYRAVARIEKSIGKQGEVVAVAADGLPLYVPCGLAVTVVPPRLRGPRVLHIDKSAGDGSGRRLSFRELADLDGAKALVGRTLLAREQDIPREILLRDRRGLVGIEVRDEVAGYLGRVEEVLVGESQDVLVVRDGEQETLIPLVDELVRLEDGVARTTLPEGLAKEGGANA